jgi:membrane-bound lytic murein transglycosylase D
MPSTRSNNSPLLRCTLLATLLSVAGCTSFPSTGSAPDAKSAGAGATQTGKHGAGKSNLAGDDGQGDQLIETREYHDLWERVRNGYAMPPLEGHLVELHERWFMNNPEYMESMVSRARFYLYYIVEEVEKRGMPMEIALLPAIESAYKPHAYSRARAAGLWQFIPSTGRIYGLEMNWWYDGRRDVMASTRAALDYLEKLHNQFGDWQLALAAYNCGERKVERLVAENKRKGLAADYSALTKLPRETRNYVPKLMAMVHIVSDPAKYGLQLVSIPNTEYFAQVETHGQIDLGVVARLTDMPVDELFMINPGYQRWITDPNGPHALLIPADKKEALVEGLSKLGDEERVQWARHEVKRGDTMSRVASHYSVTVDAIRGANSLSSNHLAVGQNLLIPVSANKLVTAEPPAYIKALNTGVKPASAATGERVKIVHRVRAGESLWSIARKYRVYVNQLREWNLLEENDALRLGQRLSIWTTRSSGTSAARGTLNPG